jgi:hypothetical protein
MEKFFNLLANSKTSLIVAIVALLISVVANLLISYINEKSKNKISLKIRRGDREIILKDFTNDQTERIVRAIDEINKKPAVKSQNT